ncbi:MAG TPA: glycoside hydrolase family 88 protein [Candidatus Eisenbergiella stercorigallinarum]|uniref:Glycoside hydrolase family 88 protein n=1 Tax=Candidatus Eisenbergiella stercorigallinarum TaxID=2838557 RepID=A0A9D2U120_9FIRM|nr:glycoside hydrolase family 88 protein [Candidatus Eisenbergiella stercorigallinarum]
MEGLQELLQRTETIQKVNALQEQAGRLLFSWPALTGKDRMKRAVRRYLLRRELPPVDHYSWPNALLAAGLSQMQRSVRDNRSEEVLIRYYDRWIKKGMPLYYVDNVTNGTILLDLYENTGEKKYLEAAGKLASFLKEHRKDERGDLLYRIRDEADIYADTVGMVSPFLCRYGISRGESIFVKMGVMQIVHFLDGGMDEKSGLPYHGFNSRTGVKYGCVGWGRAVGWLMLGMAESLSVLPEKTPQFLFIQGHLQNMVRRIVDFQRPDGSFSWLLPAFDGPADTSATAMIACAMLAAIRRGCLEEDWTQQIGMAAEFLLSCVKNGRVDQCSAECSGFAEYPQRYGSYPWGDGMTLKLFGMMEEV